MDASLKKQLEITACKVRMGVIEGVYNAKSGHPGGSLSVADLLTYLYFHKMYVDPKNPKMPDRDRLVLSKGHTAPALYSVLAQRGFFDVEELKTLSKIGSRLQGHPDMKHIPGVDMSTGSLGQGISAACGMALSGKISCDNYKVYAVLGDGEIEEGQVWEAAQFAAHYKLDNLVCFVDSNKRQLDGAVEDIMSHGKGLRAKFDAFGWNAIELEDGNDVEQIYDAVQEAYATKGQPTAIILNTIKGKGATFAESTGAHSSQPTPEQWEEAIAAAEAELAAVKAAK